MFRKLLNFILLSQGISSTDETEPEDKWAHFREEREAWEHERDMERAAPVESDGDQRAKPE